MIDESEIDVSIVPIPVHLKLGEGLFTLEPGTRILVSHKAHGVGEYLNTLLPFPLQIEGTTSGRLPAGHILLSMEQDNPAHGIEGYQLTVNPEGVEIYANQPAGLFYGVQSLRQFILPERKVIPAVQIVDQPRFSWRGIMLDVGRHIFPMDFIKRLIDIMAFNKLNVLHWHLTEDQGWRIEIKKYPRLTKIGSKRFASPILTDRGKLDSEPYGGYYTQEQVREIVTYATNRFITVVPEIEMPGHSIAALASYPKLGCTGGPYQVRTYWGIEKDVYCAGNKVVFTFLQNVLDEVLTLFPSEFIHIGGDECPKDRWSHCPKCQRTIRRYHLKDEHELQSYFIKKIEVYLNTHGRRLIGWDEILEGGLAQNASVMSWRGMEGGIEAVKAGHDVVMTPTEYCYLDYYQSEDIKNEPPAIGAFLPLEKAYAFDPVPHELSSIEATHILGLQGNLWTEFVPTPRQAEYMLFPRACALAEVAWSPIERRDFKEFKLRLANFITILENMGVNYRHL